MSPAWAQDERLVRAAWSRLAEPEDDVAAWAREALGPVEAMRHVLSREPLPADVAEAHGAGATAARRLAQGLERWRVRLAATDPRRDRDLVEGLGGRLVVPGDAEWPVGLDDLGPRAPACLWVRGEASLAEATRRSVALVGARACTPYGEHVASGVAAGAAQRSVGVVSGGAFGIDAAAHRGAMAADGVTVAVLACGVDRCYPRAHDGLLARVREGGAVVSEAAPGSSVTRWRFLQRNRLIAAVSSATVVVEAAWRSGAFSTAAHAAALGRPLGAVPGPVTSASSAGCHRVLRELDGTCVTDAEEVLELVLPVGALDSGHRAPTTPGVPRDVPRRPHDDLDPVDLRVYDALPLRTARPVRSVARVAGLPERQVVAALGRLSLAGLARAGSTSSGEQGWRRPTGG